MMHKKENKKNYIILAIIYILVIALVLYLASWYTTYMKYQKEIPVLQNVVSEIKPDELDHYLMENPSPILYLGIASNDDCRDFEESIKPALEKNNYQDLTYVNLENISNINSYIAELLSKYEGTDYSVERIPCLIKFTDGKITSIEDGLNGAVLTESVALNFIEANESDF